MTVHHATLSALAPEVLYGILRLRSQVFVVEQECAFGDPDGRDLDRGTVHWWAEDGGEVVSYLRVLDLGGGGWEIGRVVTAPEARHRGLAGRLMKEALADCGRPVIIKAQSRLVPWYGTFGFVRTGADFDEDGQPHTPMRLD